MSEEIEVADTGHEAYWGQETFYVGYSEWQWDDTDGFWTLTTVSRSEDDPEWFERYQLYMECWIVQIAPVAGGFEGRVLPCFWSSSAPTGPALYVVTLADRGQVALDVVHYWFKQCLKDLGYGRAIVDAHFGIEE